jgi:hypothetical protein
MKCEWLNRCPLRKPVQQVFYLGCVRCLRAQLSGGSPHLRKAPGA